MSTEIEKYLRFNRQNLDVESPDDERIWKSVAQKIHADSNGKKKSNIFTIGYQKYRNVAAAVIITLSLGYIAYDIIYDSYRNNTISLDMVSSDLWEREKEYRTLVSFKEEEVSMINLPDNEIIRDITSELATQDLIYREAIKDLKELGNDPQVINIIFDTYERKIQLLELLIIETNKQINYETDNRNSL